MSSSANLQIAKTFLTKMASGAPPDDVAALFSADLDWNVPGDVSVLPWVGHQSGQKAVTDFLRESASMIKRISFEVHELYAFVDTPGA